MTVQTASDESVRRWLVLALSEPYRCYPVNAEHRSHQLLPEPQEAAFGINYTGYCPTCADSEARIYFWTPCDCGELVQVVMSVGSWEGVYSELRSICWDILAFEEDDGQPDPDYWHPVQ